MLSGASSAGNRVLEMLRGAFQDAIDFRRFEWNRKVRKDSEECVIESWWWLGQAWPRC